MQTKIFQKNILKGVIFIKLGAFQDKNSMANIFKNLKQKKAGRSLLRNAPQIDCSVVELAKEEKNHRRKT